ncbi:MAG: rRNA maturation RNase YbeY [Sedimentisphaerales bacterium]
MITVHFYTRQKFTYPVQKFKKLVKSICKRFGVNNAIINIVITDNRQIRSLNKKFHHRNAVTDCLSFNLSEEPRFPHFSIERKFKKISAWSPRPSATSAVKKSFDIIVNAQKAGAEAKKRGHSPQAELALYITHGLLHNLGFDDLIAKKAKVMHCLEDEILQQHGFGRVFEKSVTYNEKDTD